MNRRNDVSGWLWLPGGPFSFEGTYAVKRLLSLWWLLAVLLVVVAGGSIWYRSHNPSTEAAEQNKLQTLPAQFALLVETVSGTGVVQPRESVVVCAQVPGRVVQVFKDHGDTVREGEKLLVLDDSELRLKVERARAAKKTAEAGLKAAQAEVEKATSIHEAAETELEDARKGDFPRTQLRVAETKVKAAKAAISAAEAGVQVARDRVAEADAVIKEAEYALSLTVIRVPFVDRPGGGGNPKAGHSNVVGTVLPSQPGRAPREFTILDRKVGLNQLAGPPAAAHLFTLSGGPEYVEVHAQISEGDVARIAVDQDAVFNVSAYPDELFWGKVVEVRPVPANVQGAVFYTVVIEAKNRRDQTKKGEPWCLRPGMPTSSLDIVYEKHSGPDGSGQWLVPNAALDYPLDEYYHDPEAKGRVKAPDGCRVVWVWVNNRRARPVFVKVGASGKYLEAQKDQDSAYTVVQEWKPAGEEPPAEAKTNPALLPKLVINADPPKKSKWSGMKEVLRLQ